MEMQSEKSLEDILKIIQPQLQKFEEELIASFEHENSLVNQVSQYIIKSGGKRLRPALVFLFAGMVGQIEKKHYELATAVELIHSATLVHDDIIDDADCRRNSVVVHKKWDTKMAVLAGDYLLAKSLKKLTNIGSIDVLDIFSSTMEEICEGEVEQSIKSELISIDDYIKRAKRKTAMLFAAATKSAVKQSADVAYEYGINLGIAFQIIDDLLVFNENYEDKTQEVDFNNKLMTAPVILAAQNGVKIDFDGSFEDFKASVVNSGAIAESKKLLMKYADRAIENLAVFEDNKYKVALCDLVSYVVSREI